MKGISLKEASQEHVGMDLKRGMWVILLMPCLQAWFRDNSQIILHQFGEFYYKTEDSLGFICPGSGQALEKAKLSGKWSGSWHLGVVEAAVFSELHSKTYEWQMIFWKKKKNPRKHK